MPELKTPFSRAENFHWVGGWVRACVRVRVRVRVCVCVCLVYISEKVHSPLASTKDSLATRPASLGGNVVEYDV